MASMDLNAAEVVWTWSPTSKCHVGCNYERVFQRTVTSTWVEAGDPGDCQTWRSWRSRVRKEPNRPYDGASRSSVYEVVSEPHQVEVSGSFSSGAKYSREGAESREERERLGRVDSQIGGLKNIRFRR